MGLEQGTQVEIFHLTLLPGQRMGESLLEKLSESETRLLEYDRDGVPVGKLKRETP